VFLDDLKLWKQGSKLGFVVKGKDACLSLRLGIALRTCKVSSLDSSHPWDYVNYACKKTYSYLKFIHRNYYPNCMPYLLNL
jgi:hypothetical protein